MDLDSADIRGVRSFRTVTNLKCDLVTLSKIFELNILELIAVEKEIFFLTLAMNEPEAAFVLSNNCSFWHGYKRNLCD